MKLIANIDVQTFFKVIAQCNGDVFFHSEEGDHLNLKSTLSQYIFAVIESGGKLLTSGEIICTNVKDEEKLKDFAK